MKIEKTILVLFLIALLFKFLHWPGGSIILILSLCALSILYFPLAFYTFSIKEIKKEKILISIGYGWLLSVCFIGVLFKLMYWPSASFIISIGSFFSIILSVLALYLYKKSDSTFLQFHKNLAIRTITICILSLFFSVISTETLIRFQYQDDPKYGELLVEKFNTNNPEEVDKKIDAYIFEKNRNQ